MTNTLVEIAKLGQSIWYDNIRRAMLTTGDLARKIEEDDLRGVTSNPTIFEKAITGSGDYDEQLRALVSAGKSVPEIYEELVVADIAAAADTLRPVYDRTDGHDGFISLEVDPRLAYDTEKTIAEAERLFRRLNRPNVMIKIPASQEGLPAIEESIYRGININITMIFSIENYTQVAESFIRGLERRAAEGRPVRRISSVASFFVSRVDTLVDAELGRLVRETETAEEKAACESLLGTAAVANAKLAYEKFKEIFHGERFAAMREAGAQVQRPLWASTSTKNPSYYDLMYVDTLIGPETVNTVPPATYTAIRDHGRAALTLEKNVDESLRVFGRLGAVGVDLRAVTEKLQRDGLEAFVKSFDTLHASISAKRDALISGIQERLAFSLGKYADAAQAALKAAEEAEAVRRIWRKDAALWKTDEAQQKIINNALGWLTVIDQMTGSADELQRFAAEVSEAGFRHVLVCGMGGSSLCPEVLRQTFGKQDGSPELLVLDSTDPDTVAAFAAQIDVMRTLFIISSKSGTTTEPIAFYKYWFVQARQRSEQPGKNFVAITDPGTLMEKMAAQDHFRKIFLNPPDIGGRYSALSYFGLLPAALQGLDVKRLLDRAERISHSCTPVVPVTENPGARLGAAIAECAKAGRNKLTIIADPRVASLGLWIEQLIAESTGKEGKGIVPVAGERLGSPSVYGDDRLFVSIAVERVDSDTDARLRALEAAGHPVVRRTLSDLYDIGEEFFLWEMATAFAGWRLGINPFDQPNVQESKDATRELLAAYKRDGRLPEQTALARDGALALYTDEAARSSLPTGSFDEILKAHLARAKPGDYVALLDYFEETEETERLVQSIRTHLRDATRCATTTGYGPRFLHSTGQLHKGGPDTGVFLQLTAADKTDTPVPGGQYTFGILKQAQALGDFRSLARHNRRALRVELGADVAAALTRLRELIREALPLSETTSA